MELPQMKHNQAFLLLQNIVKDFLYKSLTNFLDDEIGKISI